MQGGVPTGDGAGSEGVQGVTGMRGVTDMQGIKSCTEEMVGKGEW